MPEYPLEIKESDFKDASVTAKSSPITLNVERSVFDLSSKNTTDQTSCGIAELWIESPTTEKSCKKSFDKYQTIPSATDQAERFHFVPLLEELKVNWKFKNHKFVKSAELELFRNDDGNAQKLWTKKIIWDVGTCPEEGNTPFNGDFSDTASLRQAKDAKEVVITDVSRQEDFPHKCLSVEPSPYMLRLTITEATVEKAMHTRWLFLDVLVHSVEMEWGADTLLPQNRPDITDDAKHVGYQAKVLGYEKNILDELKTANPRPDAANVVHQVKLDSNLFAVAGRGQPSEEPEKTTDYEEYEALWGNGPRIPLLAKVHLRKSDDTSTKDDSGAAEQVKVAKALGNSQVLWDWADDAPQRWKEPLSAGATNKTESFLDIAHNQHNRPSLPDNSCNCPTDLGGKRGDDNAKIFPKQDNTGSFGFKVTPCSARKWASRSSFGTTFDWSKDKKTNPTAEVRNPTNVSGVIFQPARQSGDAYTVVAYMDFVQKPSSRKDIQTVPALQSKPAKFKVFRRVKVNYMVRGSNAKLGCDPQNMKDAAKRFYLKEVDVDLDVTVTQVNEPIYLQALKKTVEDFIKDEVSVSKYHNTPLLLPNLINTTDPPADGPALTLYSKDVFLNKVRSQIQNSRLRVLDTRTILGTKKKNLVVGTVSGAKGEFLIQFGTNPDETQQDSLEIDRRLLVLLDSGSAEFQAGDKLKRPAQGVSSPEEIWDVKINSAKSCWGHKIETEEDTGQAYKEAIDVVINGTPHLAKYEKSFVTRHLKDELGSREKSRLLAALQTAASTQDESQPMIIKLRGRIHSDEAQAKRAKNIPEDQITDNAAERMKKLGDFIEEQFETYLIPDRKKMSDAFTTVKWEEIGDYRFKEICTKDVAVRLFQPLIVNYAAQVNAGADGIHLMHVAGRTNASLLAPFDKDETCRDPLVAGGFYPDGTGERSSGIVFFTTIPQEKAQKVASRKPEDIISHEIGHALFLPHANSSVVGGNLGSSRPLVHIVGDNKDHQADKNPFRSDNCTMNYDLDSGHFCGICMLRLRGWKWEPFKGVPVPELYEYKIDFVLDDVDTLFADPATPKGKMERLQALGLFNHPLRHPKALDCLAYSMEHAKQLGILAGTDVAALKPLISQFLMQGGVHPNPGQFAKMRLPKNNILYSQGMLKILFPEDFSQYGTDDEKAEQKYSEKFMLGADPYEVDQLFFKDNPTLGKIPFKVTVKKRIKNSGQDWSAADAAPNVSVYFKLITPDPLPAYVINPNPPATALAGGNSYYNQIIAPPAAAIPETNLNAILTKGSAAATDPDAKNAPAAAGGKRIGKNKANVFCGTREQGFGAVSESASAGSGHEFSARVMTDQTGTARICFNPSAVGGDAYKLRVYVGPTTQEKNGQPLGDDAVETGTMVRWRTARISRSLQMPPPASDMELSAALHVRPNGSCAHPKPEDGDANQTGRVCAACLRNYGDMPPVDLKSALTLEMAKAYNELILEPQALAPVAINTLGQSILSEIDDLLNTYPRLNSLYWVRMSEKQNYGLASDYRISFPLNNQAGQGGKLFTASIPNLIDNLATDDKNNVCLLTTPSGSKSPFVSVAERTNAGQKADNILEEKTGDGLFVDTGKIPGGAKAVIDYASGKLTVTFNQPQPNKQFYAWYSPTAFLDFRSLLYFPPKSPFLFNLQMPDEYNRNLTAGNSGAMPMVTAPDPPTGRIRPDLHFKYINDRNFGAVKTLLMIALGRAATRYAGVPSGAYCPGLVFVRALALDTYEGVWGSGVQEGKAVGNIVYVFGGGDAPPQCGLAPLTMHETSHGLYMFHAPGGGADPNKPERHDLNYTCVMSYAANQGDYCGKCNASMRGMKIN